MTISGKHMEQPMHKEPKNKKKLAEHEAKESPATQAKEEVQAGEHLQHSSIANELGDHMCNDLAYHLHHPQLKGPKGPMMPPKNPKG